MVGVSRRTKKAATLAAMAMLLVIVLNLILESYTPKEFSLLAAVLLATLLMWPILHHFLKKTRYAGIFYKINSTRGLRFIDNEGRRHSFFWTAVGDFALIVFFAGIGTAFVVNNVGKQRKRAILAILAFLSVFAYAGPNLIEIFPMGFYFSENYFAILMAVAAGYGIYKLSNLFSNRASTLSAFFLALAFFGSPYFLTYLVNGSVYSLLIGLSMGTIGLTTLIIVPLAVQAFNLAIGTSNTPGINPGYPMIENGVPVLKYAGTNISIPFFPDILIAFVLMIALHEGFHGLVARAQGIRLKNTGLLLLSIIPAGAFVEPDEKQFKKETPVKQMRVYAAGSFANMFVVAVAALLLGSLLLTTGAVKPEGFIVTNVTNNTAAYGLIHNGDVITSVGGIPTPTYDDFYHVIVYQRPGTNLTIVTQNSTTTVTLGKSPNDPDQGYVGLRVYQDLILPIFAPSVANSQLEPSPWLALFSILKWIFFLNLMLGIMNLLPLAILDGGFIYRALFLWLEEKVPHGKKLHLGKAFSTAFSLIVLAAFVVNFSPYFH